MKIEIVIELDDEKADAFNASIFDGPEHEDPIVGDGRALALDILTGCGLTEFLESGLAEAIVSKSATLDGEPFELVSEEARL